MAKPAADTRLDHVHAMVKATSFERHALWCMNATDSPYSLDGHPGFSWDQARREFLGMCGDAARSVARTRGWDYLYADNGGLL